MSRTFRTLAAVLTGLALVAALPAPCGCAPERTASRHASEHECCAPPTGVSAAARDCCDEAPDTAAAVPSPAGPAAAAPVAVLHFVMPPTPGVHTRPSALLAPSPPPTVLRI